MSTSTGNCIKKCSSSCDETLDIKWKCKLVNVGDFPMSNGIKCGETGQDSNGEDKEPFAKEAKWRCDCELVPKEGGASCTDPKCDCNIKKFKRALAINKEKQKDEYKQKIIYTDVEWEDLRGSDECMSRCGYSGPSNSDSENWAPESHPPCGAPKNGSPKEEETNEEKDKWKKETTIRYDFTCPKSMSGNVST